MKRGLLLVALLLLLGFAAFLTVYIGKESVNWLQLEANFSQRAGMWDGGLPSLSAGEVSSEQCWATERVLSISKRSKFYISIEILYWACSIYYQECISCFCSENAKLFGKENFPYSEAAFFSSILWQNQTEGKVSFSKSCVRQSFNRWGLSWQ